MIQNLCRGYLARKNLKYRPKAINILQEKALQYLAWRDVRREQIKVKSMRRISLIFLNVTNDSGNETGRIRTISKR